MEHAGTVYYLAPECFKASSGGTKFYSGLAADIWALGMTLFTVVFNELPFVPAEEGSDPKEQIFNINWPEWLPEAYNHEPKLLEVKKLNSQISTIREATEESEVASNTEKPALIDAHKPLTGDTDDPIPSGVHRYENLLET